jgi:hypothetical protein
VLHHPEILFNILNLTRNFPALAVAKAARGVPKLCCAAQFSVYSAVYYASKLTEILG